MSDAGHSVLTSTAASVRATSSELCANGVSKHVLPTTVSFSLLNTLHDAAKGVSGKSSSDFLAVMSDHLLFSYASNHERKGNGKRKRDIDVEEEVDKIMKALTNKVDVAQASSARAVVVRLLRDLKGTNQERIVQSLVVVYRKLRPSDTGERVVIAVRLASGIPIPIGRLKGALGTCWGDGALSVDDECEMFRSFDLPFSEEGTIARALGHRSLRLITAVPTRSEI
jgi:hypothetical protein